MAKNTGKLTGRRCASDPLHFGGLRLSALPTSHLAALSYPLLGRTGGTHNWHGNYDLVEFAYFTYMLCNHLGICKTKFEMDMNEIILAVPTVKNNRLLDTSRFQTHMDGIYA